MSIAAPMAFERPSDASAEFRGGPGVVRFLELPARRCVMIDGEGRPGEEAFKPRLPGLYATAWTLRFALKRRGVVTKVRPLEGLWWTTDGSTDLDEIFGDREPARETWRWTLFIALPDEARDAEIESALATGRAKLEPAIARTLRVDRFDEGRVAQLLHLGPYSAERASIERLHGAVARPG